MSEAAGEDRAGDGGVDAGSERGRLDDRLESLRFDHRHSRATIAVVVVISLALGWYGSWLAADLGLGTVVFVLGAALSAYGLYRQPSRRAVVVVGLYALAALLVATPVLLNLPFVLVAGSYGVSDPAAFTMRLSDAIFLLVFVILAAVPGGLAWRLSTE